MYFILFYFILHNPPLSHKLLNKFPVFIVGYIKYKIFSNYVYTFDQFGSNILIESKNTVLNSIK